MTSTHLSGVWLPRLDVGQCQCPSLSHITRANSQGVEEVSASHRQPLCGAGRSERVIQITIQHGPGLVRRSCAVFIVIEMELLTCSLVHRNINLSLISDKQHVITDLRSRPNVMARLPPIAVVAHWCYFVLLSWSPQPSSGLGRDNNHPNLIILHPYCSPSNIWTLFVVLLLLCPNLFGFCNLNSNRRIFNLSVSCKYHLYKLYQIPNPMFWYCERMGPRSQGRRGVATRPVSPVSLQEPAPTPTCENYIDIVTVPQQLCTACERERR